MTAPNPFDMNQAVSSMVEHQLQDRTPLLVAQTMLAIGNNLRAQAFAMTAEINISQFATKPAKLVDGSALVLLAALKYVPNSYRLFVNPVKLADGSLVRSIQVVNEVEGDLLKTQFLTLTEEQTFELNRQLEAVSLPIDGAIELCLAVVTQPIEGYEYAESTWVAPVADGDAASTDTPAANADVVAEPEVVKADVDAEAAAPVATDAPAADAVPVVADPATADVAANLAATAG